jgi:Condensation domain
MEHRRLHWKSHLAGATRVQMPVDDLPEDLQPYSFRELRISFGTSLSSQLRQLAQVVGTTVAMLILSLYCGLVARWCSQNDFVVNFLVDGRTDPRYSDVVGLFAAGLCLRIRLSGKETFLDLLRLTTSEFFTAYENFDFGDHIREFPDMYRGTRIQWLPWSEEQLAGLPDTSTWDRQGELKVQKFRERSLLVEDGLPPDFKMEEDVVWHFSDGADGIGGRGFYRADRFSRHGIEMFIAELRRICEMAVENPKALVTSFVPSNSCRVVSIPSGHPHPDIAARSR